MRPARQVGGHRRAGVDLTRADGPDAAHDLLRGAVLQQVALDVVAQRLLEHLLVVADGEEDELEAHPASRILRASAQPSISGRPMSRMATSGFSVWMSRRRCGRRSLGDHAQALVRSNARLRPSRKNGWSSAITIATSSALMAILDREGGDDGFRPPARNALRRRRRRAWRARACP